MNIGSDRAVATMVGLLLSMMVLASAAFATTVVDVNLGDDLDAKANAAAAGSIIQVHGKAGVALYVYSVNQPITLKAGTQLVGDTGTVSTFGPANVPHPSVGVKGVSGAGLTTMIKSSGDNTRIAWLDLDAALTQKAVNGINGGPGQQVDHVVCKNAPASCVGQYRGFVSDSEFVNNGTDSVNFDGTASAIKCNYACEIKNVYMHDNPGNGAWCDVGCQSVSNQPNGFWVHDSVAAHNGRHGIFDENNPKPDLNPGDTTKGLIAGNYSYGNAKSGISCSDAQFCTIDGNHLGVRPDGTIDHDAGNDGIELHSSGDLTRGVQHDALVQNNDMHTETIDGTGTDRDGTPNTGCGDNGNVCTNNN